MATNANRKLVIKLLLVSVSTFLLGVFAMPPLYAKFCQITGIGQAGVRIAEEGPEDAAEDRTVRVLLDANSNSALPWDFAPLERSIPVRVGELSETYYEVRSNATDTTSGRAVYNVTPPEAARYFVKTECFCFSRQSLAAGEQRDMPVRFYIDSGLPEDISEITLSYTFFPNTDQASAPQQRESAPVPN